MSVVSCITPWNHFTNQVNERKTWISKPSERTVTTKKLDYSTLRSMFGYLPVDIVKKTFQSTTQYAGIPMSTVLKKRYKAVYPALNVHCRSEPVATDTVYSDTPAIDLGTTSDQLSVRTQSLGIDVYAMKSNREFINTGSAVIISPLLQFRVKERVDHPLDCRLLTLDTKKIIFRCNVRSAEDPDHTNLGVHPINQNPLKIIKFKSDSSDSTSDSSHVDGEVPTDGESSDQVKGSQNMPTFDLCDLVGSIDGQLPVDSICSSVCLFKMFTCSSLLLSSIS